MILSLIFKTNNKIMKKILKYLIVTVLGLLTYSCYYDQLPDEDNLPLPTGVSFQNDVQKIFNINCVSCHSSSQAPDLRSSNSFNMLTNGNYVVPFDAANSTLFKALIGQGAPLMPPAGALRQADINIVRQWIDEGALNN